MVQTLQVVNHVIVGAREKPLPSPITFAISVFSGAYRLFRWFRLGKIYSNPDNFLKLAAGHTMNFCFSHSIIIKLSAISLLIATRILECVEQINVVEKEWNRLKFGLRGQFKAIIAVKWKRKPSAILSCSTIAWYQFQGKTLWERISRIALAFFRLIKEVFILSMQITDTAYAFFFSTRTQNESYHLFFVNASLWMEKLLENKTLLIGGLYNNRELIQSILKGVGSSLTVDQMIKVAKIGIDKTETVHRISHCTNDFISLCAYKWGDEFLRSLGLRHLISAVPPPPSTPPWEIPCYKKTVQYIPIRLLTRPIFLKKSRFASQSLLK